MAVPPRDPWYRRGWVFINRPYPYFGCLWLILWFLLIYMLISLLFASVRVY